MFILCGRLSLLSVGISRHDKYTLSADHGHLDFPRVKLASYGGRSFAYAGPSNWNSLPAYLRDSSLSLSSFKHHIKTFLFSFYYASTRSVFGVLLQKNALSVTVIIIIVSYSMTGSEKIGAGEDAGEIIPFCRGQEGLRRPKCKI